MILSYFEPFKDDIKLVFMEAERRISLFPEPLNHQGRVYINLFNPLEKDSSNNYICYLLPYWMKDIAPLTAEQCFKLSLANIFGMLYFFIQDDLMDSLVIQEERTLQMALANLFNLQMTELHRELFTSDSLFWHYYNQYVTEWAQSVINETTYDFFNISPLMIAKKSGPVKIASTGALLLTKQTHLIALSEEIIEHTLATLQMVDDWIDWETDLREGNYNCLLAMIHSDLEEQQPITIEIVKQQIYLHSCLEKYIKIAKINNHDSSEQINIPFLSQFNHKLIQTLQEASTRIEKKKEALLLGGIFHLLVSDKH